MRLPWKRRAPDLRVKAYLRTASGGGLYVMFMDEPHFQRFLARAGKDTNMLALTGQDGSRIYLRPVNVESVYRD